MSCSCSFLYTHLNSFEYCYLTLAILLIKYSYLIQTICTQQYNLKWLIIIFVKWFNSSIWSVHETLTSTTNPGLNGIGNYCDKGVLHIVESARIEAWPSVLIWCHILDTCQVGVLPPPRISAVGVFYSPSQLGVLVIWNYYCLQKNYKLCGV